MRQVNGTTGVLLLPGQKGAVQSVLQHRQLVGTAADILQQHLDEARRDRHAPQAVPQGRITQRPFNGGLQLLVGQTGHQILAVV